LPGGKRLFFVEAKKPNIDIKNNISVAYQIRRYGWSAKLPVSIITDFEEFAVYDCTKKPKPTDKSGIARIKYIKFRDYLKEFDYLWDTFSKERVLKGSFDKYIKSDTVKKGTATVDKDFLASLDNWRTYLATSFSLRNKELDEDEINYAVQLTIDRLIFLRIAEDRGVEQYGQLKTSVNQKGDAYQNLFSNFRKADEKYNSGLFDFKKDVISETLKIDNKVIKTIVNEMYYPESPYEFSVISVEILGSAYEQFLGKVIRITPAHQAKVEEKPEVRKAGGVYYTPQYVVDYIVKNTVGKLIDGKTPKQIEKIKICDPACGSGSFLIGAYQYLLDHYKNYYYSFFEKYSKDAANNKLIEFERKKAIRERNKLPLTPSGELDSHLRKEILLNHIFGVDIDTNAVEVTKLSLLLKCMEGITVASIQKLDFKERVLPTLENNIKSGNSLVDTDYYDSVIDFGEEKKVKPFNWQKAFPEVFEQGGFDTVIGNPPYIRIQSIVENSPSQGNYFHAKYKSASKGNYDIYVIFIEHSLNLIHEKGLVGFILPHKFFTAQYGDGIRQLLLSKNAIEEIIHFGHQQVFSNATTYTCILTLNNQRKSKVFNFIKVDDLELWKNSDKKADFQVNINSLSDNTWNFISDVEKKLFDKLNHIETKLEDVTNRIFQGLKTSADKIYIVRKVNESEDIFNIYCPQNEKNYQVEKALFHPLIKGGDSRGYIFNETDLLILFPYSNLSLIKEDELKHKLPLTFHYLQEHKKYLENRENGKMKTSKWYGYVYPKALDVISTPKIFTPDISPSASFSFDESGEIFFTGGVSGGYGIITNEKVTEKYLLGLLNSKLLDWYLKKISTQMRGGWYSYESKYIKHLPIKILDKNNTELVQKSNEIERLVVELIKLNTEKHECPKDFL
jgi:type I restriction-modification system DNA methylase subunit